VLAYFRLHRDARVEKTFRTPLYPVLPLVFLGAAVFIVLDTLLTAPVQALFALVLIALGVPVYLRQARAPVREPVLAPVEERTSEA
jgi:Flp pilus assembly protein TadB